MVDHLPDWAQAMELEDWQFLKRFLLASGSLKALAEEYGISYPTVRARLDRLIAKVRAADGPGPVDALHRQVRVLVAEGKMDKVVARKLLDAHRDVLREHGVEGDSSCK